MNKRKPVSKKSATLTPKEKKNVGEAVPLLQGQTDDHMFVPHIEQLSLTADFENNQELYSDLLESICGVTDDSQAVERYDGTLGVTAAFVAAHQSACCQVQWNSNLAAAFTNPGNVSGVRWGTGTMIADDLMITCGHLFDQTGGGWERPRINGTTNIISPQDIARNMKVNFNFQVDAAGTLRAEQSFPILQLIEYRLGGLDMSICRIGGNPGATFGRTAVSTTDAAPPDMLCIIGHPAGQPKRIEAGPTTLISGNLIHYSDIDTLGGNSGSGILRASDGRLVGIHTNGGCTAASPAGGGTNFGQRIAAVIAASPTLQALTRPKLKIADDPIATLKFRDDPGGGTLKFTDDPIGTLKFTDDPIVTLKFRDDPGGGGGTLKFTDDPISTLKFRDDIQPSLKFRDDVKTPGLDKQPGLEGKVPGADQKHGLDTPQGLPGMPGLGGQPVRPFILSTPHHSNAWQVAAGQEAAEQQEMESMLTQYEQAMEATEEQLRQLDSEYRSLIAQYQSGKYGGQQP